MLSKFYNFYNFISYYQSNTPNLYGEYLLIFIIISKMQEQFKAALNYIKNLPPESDDYKGPSIDNETKLKFYALFKQVTVGPNNTKAPSRLKIVDRYKWDEWKKLGKMSKQDAMKTYIAELTKKAPGWNVKPKL